MIFNRYLKNKSQNRALKELMRSCKSSALMKAKESSFNTG